MSPPQPSDTSTHVSRGLAWIGTASSLVGILDMLALFIILGFWVDPGDYGIATMATWLYPILDQATDLGLSAAVIQRDDHDEDKISTVFWINLTSALVLFGLLVAVAPPLATALYEHEVIGWLLVAYGSKLVWQNFYFIPAALMKKQLRFKELSVIRIVANLAEFAGKIGFAAAGYGVWCFVLGPLCRVLVTGIGCQICHPWRPRFVLKLRQAWDYAAFGAKSAGSQILFYFYTNIDYPIVGYYFGEKALGVYKLAYEIALEPVRVISQVVIDVAFPTFARLRHTKDRLIAQFISFTRLNLVTVMTFAAVVFVIADDLLVLAFPEYVGAGDAVRIMCAVAVLRSVSYIIPPLLDGVGQPSRTLLYMITASIVLPLGFILSSWLLGDRLGFLAVAWAWAVGYPIAFAVLVMLATFTVDLPTGRYLRAVMGVPACAIAGLLVGEGLHYLGRDFPTAVRLVVDTVGILGVIAVLLAYTQGLSVRTAVKALRGSGGGDAPAA